MKKVIKILSLIIVLLILLFVLCIVDYNNKLDNFKNNYKDILNEYKEDIEYGTTWTYDELLSNLVKDYDKLNIKFNIENKTISKSDEYTFDKVGKIKVSIEFSTRYKYYFINTDVDINKTITLDVVDTNYPIIEGFSDIEITKDDTVSFDNIKAYDKVDGELEYDIDSNVNTDEVGEYSVTITSTDKNGNETKQTFKVVVKAKPEIKSQTKNASVGHYINNILIVNKTYSIPSTYAPGGLLSSFNENFSKMKSAAASEGINLYVVSGYRSYERQEVIYNNYVARDGKELADTYSARPGHSEHQTGLAADINLVDSSFENTTEGIWLNNNCYKYGFIIRYPKGKESKTGYMYEPWHIRYVGVDIATKLYNNGSWISLEEYFNITSEYNY